MIQDSKEYLTYYVGIRVKERREELSLTQLELSEKLKMSRASISNMEKGRHQIPLTTLFDLSKVLGVNMSYFLPVSEIKLNNFENYNIQSLDERYNEKNNSDYLNNIINSI